MGGSLCPRDYRTKREGKADLRGELIMLVSLTPEELERLVSLLKPGRIFKDEYKDIYTKLDEVYRVQKGE